MAQVAVRPMLSSGGVPSKAAMKWLERNNSLAGVRNPVAAMGGMGHQSGLGDWSSVLQNLTTTFGGTLSQIALNKNQAKSVQTTPYGSTVYYPATSAALNTSPTLSAVTKTSSSAIYVVGGIALVAVILMMRK